MLNYFKGISVIIRSANERTEGLCKKLILDQGISENQLFIVKEVPFSAALKKSFETGLEQNRKWTYCIDADVLLQPESIQKMIDLAEKEKENVCEIQGFVMDKFFGGPRQAGNHLYRTSLLSKMIDNIPREGTDIRPERYALGKMAEQGYTWKSVPCIVGLHDEYQSYFDIFRKSFVHGVKHLDRAELLVKTWRQKCDKDPDFKVALKGFSDSIANTKSTYINSELPLYKEKFKDSGFEEKLPLKEDEYSLESIENTIKNWEYSDLYYYYFPDRDGLDMKQSATLHKVKRNIRRSGYIKTAALAASEILLSLGNKIRPN